MRGVSWTGMYTFRCRDWGKLSYLWTSSVLPMYLTLLYELACFQGSLQAGHLLTCSYECWQCIVRVHRSGVKTVILKGTMTGLRTEQKWSAKGAPLRLLGIQVFGPGLRYLRCLLTLSNYWIDLGIFKNKNKHMLPFLWTISELLTVWENGFDQRIPLLKVMVSTLLCIEPLTVLSP